MKPLYEHPNFKSAGFHCWELAPHLYCKVLSNVAKDPANEKYRQLRLGNAKVRDALAGSGAEALLAALGFTRRKVSAVRRCRLNTSG